VALSEEERRLLEQMEQALAADDPKLANALRGTGARRLQRRRALLAGLGFLVGVAGLLVGMETFPLISIAGFLLMLVSALVLLASWQRAGDAAHAAQARPGDAAFIDKLEERFRRHNDDGA